MFCLSPESLVPMMVWKEGMREVLVWRSGFLRLKSWDLLEAGGKLE